MVGRLDQHTASLLGNMKIAEMQTAACEVELVARAFKVSDLIMAPAGRMKFKPVPATASTGQHVIAEAAIKMVVPAVAAQIIVTGAALQYVSAAPARNVIIAASANERVGTIVA